MRQVDIWKNPEVGAYYRQIKKFPILTQEEKLELFEAYRNGDQEARKQLIQSDLRWAAHVAKRYFGTFGMDPMDIIQYANMGLMRAIEGYDPTRKTCFTVYASYCIRTEVRRGIINDGRLLHIPHQKTALQTRMLYEIDDYYKKNGTYLNQAELAKRLNVKEQDVELLLLHLDLPLWLEGLTSSSHQANFFDYENALDWTDFFEDPMEQVDNVVLGKCLEQELYPTLSQVLDPKELDILCRYYGLQEYDPAVLGGIASVYQMSRERVRQILRKAEHELSTSCQLEPFKEYVTEGTYPIYDEKKMKIHVLAPQNCKKREKVN